MFSHLENWEIDNWRVPETAQESITKISIFGQCTDRKWRQTAKYYYCYGRKISKRATTASIEIDRIFAWQSERESEKESEKSMHNLWLGNLTCHQPDNSIPPDLHPNHHIHKQQQCNPHTPTTKSPKQRICLLMSRDGLGASPKHWCSSLERWACFNLRERPFWKLQKFVEKGNLHNKVCTLYGQLWSLH